MLVVAVVAAKSRQHSEDSITHNLHNSVLERFNVELFHIIDVCVCVCGFSFSNISTKDIYSVRDNVPHIFIYVKMHIFCACTFSEYKKRKKKCQILFIFTVCLGKESAASYWQTTTTTTTTAFIMLLSMQQPHSMNCTPKNYSMHWQIGIRFRSKMPRCFRVEDFRDVFGCSQCDFWSCREGNGMEWYSVRLKT